MIPLSVTRVIESITNSLAHKERSAIFHSYNDRTPSEQDVEISKYEMMSVAKLKKKNKTKITISRQISKIIITRNNFVHFMSCSL